MVSFVTDSAPICLSNTVTQWKSRGHCTCCRSRGRLQPLKHLADEMLNESHGPSLSHSLPQVQQEQDTEYKGCHGPRFMLPRSVLNEHSI